MKKKKNSGKKLITFKFPKKMDLPSIFHHIHKNLKGRMASIRKVEDYVDYTRVSIVIEEELKKGKKKSFK